MNLPSSITFGIRSGELQYLQGVNLVGRLVTSCRRIREHPGNGGMEERVAILSEFKRRYERGEIIQEVTSGYFDYFAKWAQQDNGRYYTSLDVEEARKAYSGLFSSRAGSKN